MPIILNENIQSNSPKSLDNKYMVDGVTPYADVAEVNSIIPLTYRSIGLTVNIANVEYWYKDGVADTDLILKCCSSLIEKTHAEMITLKTNSEFVKGQQYLITDFRTRHEIPNTTDFFIGVLEPLIVEAVSETEIATEALSTTYPMDVIRYQLIDSTNYGNDRGRITYRLDTLAQLSAYYDWKNVKFRRWETPDGFFSLTDNGNAFQDFYTFQNSISPSNSFSVFLPEYFGFGMAGFPALNNVVFLNSAQSSLIETGYFGDNTFYDFIRNTVTNSLQYNYCTSEFADNTINLDFSSNKIIGNCKFNTINAGFRNNVITSGVVQLESFEFNEIYGVFQNNNIQSGFLNNTTKGLFRLNTILTNFRNNKIGDYFQGCQVSDNFQYNNILAPLDTIDFSLATHVYTLYTKTIIKRQDNADILYYLTPLNTLEYVSPTS